MSDESQFTEDIRVRVPPWIRDAYKRLARKKLKKEAELAREALLAYLASEGESAPTLQETSPPYGVKQAAAEGSSRAKNLLPKSGTKQKAESPSANKSSQAGASGSNPK